MGKYFSLTFYEKNRQEGELWVRTPNNTVLPAQQAFSKVFLKYKDVSSDLSEGDSSGRTFYQDVMDGNFFLRFDMIHDVLFVETSRGNIFDQIIVENNEILPRTQDNNFTTSLLSKRLTFPDYWFDENNKKLHHDIKNYYYINFYDNIDFNKIYSEDLFHKTMEFNWIPIFEIINNNLDNSEKITFY